MRTLILSVVLGLASLSAMAATIPVPITCTSQEATKKELERLGYNKNLGVERIYFETMGEVWATEFFNEQTGYGVIFLIFEDGMCMLYTYKTTPEKVYERTN